MVLDTKTLFIVLTLMTVFMSGAMFFFWRIHKTYKGFAEWVMAALLAAVCLVFYLLRGIIPDILSFFAASMGLPIVQLLRLQGIRKFTGRPLLSRFYLLIPAGVLIIYTYFYYVFDSIQVRTFFLSLTVFCLTIAIAHEFYLNSNKGKKPLSTTIAILNFIYGAMFIARGIIILKSPHYKFMSDAFFETAFFIAASVFEIAWDIFFMMLNYQRTEEELAYALYASEEATRVKSRFLGIMSHEMRTPLHSFSGSVNMLEESELNEKQEKILSLLKRSLNRMQHLVDDALDITLIEAGRINLKKESFNLNEMLDELREMFTARFERKGISLIIRPAGGSIPEIVCDRNRILQVLINLVDNACKYTHNGEVIVDTQTATESIIFIVKDTGIGIEPEKQSVIFEPFSRVLDSGKEQYGGAGLGLFIVKSLCELLGGNINLKSAPGKGSRFRIEIPIQTADSKDTAIQIIHDSPTPDRLLSILAIDDVPENLELLELFFEGSKTVIEKATSAEEGFSLLKEKRYDCMLLDMQLPGFSGLEMIKRIRKEENESGIGHMPVICVSANAYADSQKKAVEAGCDLYLARPFTRQELMDTIGLLVTSPVYEKETVNLNVSHYPDRIITRARKRIRQYALEIMDACRKHDFVKIEKHSHNMKGLSRTFDFDDMTTALRELETACRSRDALRVEHLAENILKDSPTGAPD